MAAHPVPSPSERRLVAELIVRDVQGDLLEVEPLDLGPGAPATAALEHERGPTRATRASVATSSRVAYLDSSALVKLVTVEAETAALRDELARWPRRVSSLFAAVELTRTARRLGPRATPLIPRVLAGLQLLAIDPIVELVSLYGDD